MFNTRPWLKHMLRIAVFCLVLLAAVLAAGHLVMPSSNRYLSGYTAGGVLGEDCETIDVLVMGDSNAAQGVAPMEWYRTRGVTGYTYGVGWLSTYNIYYRLREIFKEQSPRVVVLCAGTLFSRRGTDDYAAAAVRELSGELLPLVRFHDEWKNMHWSEVFEQNDYTWRDVNKGFAPLTDVSANGSQDDWNYMRDDGAAPAHIPALMRWYVHRIKRLCEKNGAALVMITVPSTGWNAARHKAAAALAEREGLDYLDYNRRDLYDIGIDWRTDSSDAGTHLNVLGARKLTDALGAYLCEQYDLPDHRGRPGYEDWDTDAAQYEQDRAQFLPRAEQEAAYQLSLLNTA